TDPDDGESYVTRLDYTGNDAAGLAAYNSVRFVYDFNGLDSRIYHAGSQIRTRARITNIQSYAGAALVFDYRLTYQQSGATGRNQLSSVTLCDAANNCLPATTFTWQSGVAGMTVISNDAAGQNGANYGNGRYLGDFNGDGLPDILWLSGTECFI